LCDWLFCRATNFWFLVLLFQRKGQFRLILLLLLLKPPRLAKARTEMMPKFLKKIAALLCRLPPANSREPSLEKKRKHLDELLSSSTSIPKDAPGKPSIAKTSDLEMFDALDS
jgi:hypothetical protein